MRSSICTASVPASSSSTGILCTQSPMSEFGPSTLVYAVVVKTTGIPFARPASFSACTAGMIVSIPSHENA